jgi:hypothetical protein
MHGFDSLSADSGQKHALLCERAGVKDQRDDVAGFDYGAPVA